MKSEILRFAILAGSALVLTPAATAQSNLAGDWQGTIDANGATYHLVRHLAVAPNGALSSTIDNLDENVYGIKVKSTALQGSDITLSVDDQIQVNGEQVHLLGSFSGKLAPNGQEIHRTWTQEAPEQAPMKIHFQHQAAGPSTPPVANSASSAIVLNSSGTLDTGSGQLLPGPGWAALTGSPRRAHGG